MIGARFKKDARPRLFIGNWRVEPGDVLLSGRHLYTADEVADLTKALARKPVWTTHDTLAECLDAADFEPIEVPDSASMRALAAEKERAVAEAIADAYATPPGRTGEED